MQRVADIKTPVQLYRHLCRRVRLLPVPVQDYYKHHIRQNFKTYSDETDPDRVQQIISRAVEDAEWVIKKYTKDNSSS